MFRKNNQQDTPPNLFFHTPDSSITQETDVLARHLQADNFLDMIDVLLEHSVPIVSFTFGHLPSEVIARFKKKGTYLMGTATSLEEAKQLDKAGIDAIVVQGIEAGGHRGGFFTPTKHALIGTMALVRQITSHIKNRPIIAAGGIMDGQGITAAMALGASAVQMGTAFLTTKESGADPTYKAELLKIKSSGFDRTTLTMAYSGKTVRAIGNEFIEYMEATVNPMPPLYPILNTISAPIRREAAKQKATKMMSMWSGQGVSLLSENLTVDELFKKLREEMLLSLTDLAALKKDLDPVV